MKYYNTTTNYFTDPARLLPVGTSVSGNKVILFILFSIYWSAAFAQQPRSFTYENEFDLYIPIKNNWSMGAGVANRGLLQERSEDGITTGYTHEHLEVNHFTNYAVKNSLTLSLGLRYRFRELFDPSLTNEFRIIEQLEYEPVNSALNLSHRIRLEQRFRENTVHRIRYELEFSRPLNRVFSIGAGTEALYAVSANLKPEAEQRFSVGLANTPFRNMELELDFEYRIDNYARNPAHEFFIITGLSFDL